MNYAKEGAVRELAELLTNMEMYCISVLRDKPTPISLNDRYELLQEIAGQLLSTELTKDERLVLRVILQDKLRDPRIDHSTIETIRQITDKLKLRFGIEI